MNNKNENSNKKSSFFKNLYKKLDLPADICNGIFIELRGRTNISIHGCKKIIIYTPELVRVLMKGCFLNVRGIDLYCTAYHSNIIDVDGKIVSLDFEDGGE